MATPAFGGRHGRGGERDIVRANAKLPTSKTAGLVYSNAMFGPAATQGAFTLAANPGAYALTGAPATLMRAAALQANAGTYTLTGFDATLRRGFSLVAEPGSYSVTGADAGLTAARRLDAASGTYSLTGSSATMAAALRFDAQSGAYSLTGAPATLAYGGVMNFILPADAGSYTLAGASASMPVARALAAEPGGYALTGSDTPLTVARMLLAEPGSYGVAGFDAALLYVAAQPDAGDGDGGSSPPGGHGIKARLLREFADDEARRAARDALPAMPETQRKAVKAAARRLAAQPDVTERDVEDRIGQALASLNVEPGADHLEWLLYLLRTQAHRARLDEARRLAEQAIAVAMRAAQQLDEDEVEMLLLTT